MPRRFRKPRVACFAELPMTVATAKMADRAGLERSARLALACDADNADKHRTTGLDGLRVAPRCMRFTARFLVTPNV